MTLKIAACFFAPCLAAMVATASPAWSQIDMTGNGQNPFAPPDIVIWQDDDDIARPQPATGSLPFRGMPRDDFIRYMYEHNDWKNNPAVSDQYRNSMSLEQIQLWSEITGVQTMNRTYWHGNSHGDTAVLDFWGGLTDNQWEIIRALNPTRDMDAFRQNVERYLRSRDTPEHAGQRSLVDGDLGGGDDGGQGGSFDLEAELAGLDLGPLQADDFVDTQVSTNGWVSVQLLPIYEGYVIGQHGLTWTSLDLFPRGPSSVGSAGPTYAEGPSSVGWSLDLFPPMPSSVGHSLNLYQQGPSSVGQSLDFYSELCGR